MGSISTANTSEVKAQESTIPGSRNHVKLWCSFGGMILPRPSDGTLRYVGGETRIMNMRRDVSLSELVKKLAYVYDQEEMIIKYQLPNEDLDALVSVSCHDDLDNMMEECKELLEMFPDGSVKLRLFLFSTSKTTKLVDVISSCEDYIDEVNKVIFTCTQSCDLSDANIDDTNDSKAHHVNGYIQDSTSQPSDCTNEDLNLEQVKSNKGFIDDLVKLEHQETAEEGDSDLENNSDDEIVVEIEANLEFPLLDELGRLQIIKNNDLEDLRRLGSGTFGTVYHGKWRGTDVAIKRINDRFFDGKPSEKEGMREDFWNEAIKLADLHHPNVLAFYGIVLDGPGGSVANVTEFMVNGSLRSALQKNERSLGKRKRLLIAMDVAFGMDYLHSKNIIHLDLKSDNLLVNLRDPHRPICKVSDFGLSRVKFQTLISGGGRGTLPWMAPEHFNDDRLISEKVDVFSFGIVLWELLTGEQPYSDLHYGAVLGGIVNNKLRPQVPENCDCDWRSLMEKCWSADPFERPTFSEIANELRSMVAKIPPKGQGSSTKTRENDQGFFLSK